MAAWTAWTTRWGAAMSLGYYSTAARGTEGARMMV